MILAGIKEAVFDGGVGIAGLACVSSRFSVLLWCKVFELEGIQDGELAIRGEIMSFSCIGTLLTILPTHGFMRCGSGSLSQEIDGMLMDSTVETRRFGTMPGEGIIRTNAAF